MIRVENLTRDYGPVRALDSVSFEVGQNQILGFLGPNGAGKSTAMKIITTYLAPTSGSATPLYVDMRVDEYLEFIARARGLSGAKLKSRLDYVVHAAGIGHVMKKEIQELSKGYKQRTGLAQALIHDPPVLILDEPTSGLDPLQIVEIRNLVQELAKEKTIIFSTHILSEISSTTDRVIIIHDGRIIADGHVSALTREAVGEQILEVSLRAPVADVENRIGAVSGIGKMTVLAGTDGTTEATLTATGDPVVVQRELGELAAREGWPVLGLATKAATLEDVFLQLVREEVAHG
jgi:ABC-2 type transport system ATP-binding protein